MRAFAAVLLASLLTTADEIPVLDLPSFSREAQVAAITATVQVRNLSQGRDGSGVLIGKSGPFAYVLTAQHVVGDAKRLEVAVFSKKSYPRSDAVYRSAQVVAQTQGLEDLALIRLGRLDTVPGMLRVCPEGKVPGGSGIQALAVGCDAGKVPTCIAETAVRKRLRQKSSSETTTFWQVTREHAEGRSGGPLVDKRGYVIGICSGSNREKSYFTHIDEIQRFLKRNGFRWLFADVPAR